MFIKYEKSIWKVKIRVFETSWQLCWILSWETIKMINLMIRFLLIRRNYIKIINRKIKTIEYKMRYLLRLTV